MKKSIFKMSLHNTISAGALAAVLGCGLICATVAFMCRLVQVDHGFVAIVSDYRKRERRVIKAGLHLLCLESVVERVWTYHAETADGRVVECVERVSYINTNNRQLDCAPFYGFTVDKVSVSVNGALHYKITDPIRAFYETDELLLFLEQQIGRATRGVCSGRTYDQIMADDSELSSSMLQAINDGTKSYGVECTNFMIQSIKTTPDIENANQALVASEKMIGAQRYEAEQMHILAMEKSEMEKQSAQVKQKMELEQCEHEARCERLRVEQRQEAKAKQNALEVYRYREMLAAGIPPSEISKIIFAGSVAKTKNMVIGLNGIASVVPSFE